ncbi:MAG: TldD/PmbA family protein [Acidimicrobiia bacterium]
MSTPAPGDGRVDPDGLAGVAAGVVARAGNGEQVEAYVVRSTSLEIRVCDGAVEQLSSATSAGVGVRVVTGGREGTAWAGSLAPEIVAAALVDARDNAGFTTPDEHAGLAVPDGVAPVELDQWSEDVAAVPTADKVAFAADVERRIRADRRVRALRWVSVNDTRTEQAVATSTGIAAARRSTAAWCSAMAIAGTGDDTSTGSGLTFGRGWAGLDPDRVVDEAVNRSTRMIGARKPGSDRLPVVLDPDVAAAVVGYVASLCNGEAVLKGRSLFADRLGEVVAAPAFTLVEDPTNPAALTAAAFDAEGLATRPTTLIDAGVLAAFLYDTRWGRAAGRPSTASARRGLGGPPGVGVRAVAPVPGPLSADEILAAVGDGLYVQSVSGLHSGVDPVSGDLSVGAEGLMVRGGALAEPVKECTVASTLPRMLSGVAHLGADLEWGPGSSARLTVAIDEMSLSGA